MEGLPTPVRRVEEHRADGQLRVSQRDPWPGVSFRTWASRASGQAVPGSGHDIGRHGGGEGVSAHGQPAAQGMIPLHRLDLDELHELSDRQHAAKR
jgi:hypothetical protein